MAAAPVGPSLIRLVYQVEAGALRGYGGRMDTVALQGTCLGPNDVGSGNKRLCLWADMLCPAQSEGKIPMSYFKS